jgi:hypothetical protein
LTAPVTIGKGGEITQTKTEQKRLNLKFFSAPLSFGPDSSGNMGPL